jgi:hypothetical protein
MQASNGPRLRHGWKPTRQNCGHSAKWKAPAEMRKLGGALFGDRRFGRVFVYHNGAQSYYAGRGFRGALRV